MLIVQRHRFNKGISKTTFLDQKTLAAEAPVTTEDFEQALKGKVSYFDELAKGLAGTKENEIFAVLVEGSDPVFYLNDGDEGALLIESLEEEEDAEEPQ